MGASFLGFGHHGFSGSSGFFLRREADSDALLDGEAAGTNKASIVVSANLLVSAKLAFAWEQTNSDFSLLTELFETWKQLLSCAPVLAN